MAALLGDRGTLYRAGDAESLASAMRSLAEHPPDVLAINGGDGTVHVVLTAVMNQFGTLPPLIAVLPGGTMNTVSGSYGVRGRPLGPGPEVWLKRLLAFERVADVPSVSRSLLRVEGAGPPQYGFLFGNGLISNFLEVYYEGTEPTPQKALWILFVGICSAFVQGPAIARLMRPAQVTVTCDGVAWPGSTYLAVGAGTADDVGFGFRAFFRAVTTPGRMHALGIACSAFAFVLELPRVWLARPLKSPQIAQDTPLCLVLRAPQDQVFMIDGDFHRAGPEVTVSVCGPARLAVPR